MAEEVFHNPTGWVARHIQRYVASGGTRGHTFNGSDALLLTTRGRRTRTLRRAPLCYGRDGERYALVATAVRGGGDPSWYLNLLDDPSWACRCDRRSSPRSRHPPPPASGAVCGGLMVDLVPKYRVYERQAGRDLAVVVVERR